MFNQLRQYLTEKESFSEPQLQQIENLCLPKTIRKSEFLLRAGEVCRYHTFVSKGCLKLYRLEADGKEHIIKFAIENWWVSDRESLLSGKPGESYIGALEDSEVLQWTNDHFEALFKSVPPFDALFKRLMAKALAAASNRVYSGNSKTAEEKYREFMLQYPTLPARIPLYMIASYLGVTRETLTRIRRH